MDYVRPDGMECRNQRWLSDGPDQWERLASSLRHVRPDGMECRIACILVADFPIAALIRANPELRDKPVVLSHGIRGEVTSVSPPARAAGVRPGMTAAQARALAPGLIVAHPSPAAERSAADAILDAAESLSPIVEEGEPGQVWLDLSGSERFFQHHSLEGGDGSSSNVTGESDPRLACGMSALNAAHRVGLEASVGIASSKEVAYLAARCGGIRVIEPGMERKFLDWIPLELLALGDDPHGNDIELTLARWGIRRLGELARLDARAIGSRLGRQGVELIRLARGEGSARLIARRRAETFAEEIELEYGVESLEPLGFVMRAMLGRLSERLKMRGLAAGDMTLSLGLGDRRRDDRRVPVAAPTLEVRSMLALLNLSLEASPPPAAVETIRIAVEPRMARPAQTDMFLPPSPAPDRLQTTIARLAALYGPERVGTLMPSNSHRPEAVHIGPFAPAPPPSLSMPATAAAPATRELPAPNVARLVMRAVRPAAEVEVICTQGMPEFIRGPSLGARVISLAGPWRRQGEWWSPAASRALPSSRAGRRARGPAALDAPTAFARDYYEVALDDGGVYRVFRDLSSGQWFLDGIYD